MPSPATSTHDASPAPAADPCQVQGGRQPFLARFTADERAALASAMDRGIAVVADDDCRGLRLLPSCSARGHYGYWGTSPRTSRLDLGTDEERRVNAPTSGAGGKEGAGSALHVDVTVAGRRATTRALLSPPELVGECRGATHFVTSARIGAFTTPAAQTSTGKPSVPQACASAHAGDAAPAPRCHEVVSVSLSPIAELGEVIGFDQAPRRTTAPIGACPADLVVSRGRCVRPPTTDPFLCAFGDIAGCRTQCDRGDTDSCDVLGYMLSRASGPGKDAAGAAAAYTKSCDLEDSIACDNLGSLYMEGAGVPKDAAKAASSFERACNFGSVDGCGNLGAMYRAGEGVTTDAARGRSLSRRACDAGSVGACLAVAALELESGPDAGLPDAGSARGVALLTRLCDEDSGLGCLQLGRLHYLGEEVPPDRARAATFFDKGCRAGEDKACVMLGLQYRQADGVARDDDQATRLMDVACGHGAADGCLNLGIAYENGKGVTRDLRRAIDLYERACEDGSGRACTFWGDLLHDGSGVAKDPAKAHAAYKRACDLGEKEGCAKAQ